MSTAPLDPDDAPDADWPESPSSTAEFDGDTGDLSREQRNVLVVLLKNRFITETRHPAEWRTLSVHTALIRQRLHNLYLDLVLDTERGVAYKQSISTGTGTQPFPTLLHDARWNREETIVMVYLRAQLRSEQASGSSRAFVDRADMLEFVASHRPADSSDKAGDHKRTNNAVQALVTAGLLLGRADAERFEISPAIEVLLPVETLTTLRDWLRLQNNPDIAVDDGTMPQDETPGHSPRTYMTDSED